MSRSVKVILLAIFAALAAWFLFFRNRTPAPAPSNSGPSWWQTAINRLAGSSAVQSQIATGFGRLVGNFGGSNMPVVPAESSSPGWDVVPASGFTPGGAYEGWT